MNSITDNINIPHCQRSLDTRVHLRPRSARDGEREPAAASAVAIPGALRAHPHDDTPHAISTITAIPS